MLSMQLVLWINFYVGYESRLDYVQSALVFEKCLCVRLCAIDAVGLMNIAVGICMWGMSLG